MIIGIILLIIVIIFLILYLFFFKEYSEVMANYATLIKVVETRDLILLRILPEIKNKKKRESISELIGKRMDAKNKGNNEFILCDVNINKNLKPIYDEINKIDNPIVKSEFKRIINLEKKLKIIRREYSNSAQKFNEKLVKHPKSFIKFWHMKPLDTYEFL